MFSNLTTLILDIKRQYTFYSYIFLSTTGLIGNTLLILMFVLLRPFRNNQCAFFFTVESISNIGLFLFIFPPYFYGYVTGKDPTVLSLVWCKMQVAFPQIFGLCSLFTICFLTFDQFMTTNPQHIRRQFSTLKLAHRFTCINVCCVVLHSIPFFILSDNRPLNECNIYNQAFSLYFTVFYYPILSSAFPLGITLTFSLLAYRNVRRIVRRQLSVVRRRLDHQLTAMVVVRVFCLILLGLPYIICSLYQLSLAQTESNQVQLAITNLVCSITYSLVYMNFAINFYLFLIVSGRFRRQFKAFMLKNCLNFFSDLCQIRAHGRNRNQIVPETIPVVITNVESV